MPSHCLPYRETNHFSSLICDYLDEKQSLKPFYDNFPKLENFKDQIAQKQASFPFENRILLAEALKKQYSAIAVSEETLNNIELLKKDTTFTITTGHQLNLFTGPLYFLYKIISAINLSETLKETYPDCDFVPVYWMATEDHDFEEINYFDFKGKKVQWTRDFGGAVGELNTEGLEAVFTEFSKKLGDSTNAQKLKALFKEAYLQHDNLAQATLFLANALFSEYGLVIIDANTKVLKQEFVSYMKGEIETQIAYKAVIPKAEALEDLGFKAQVTPREINLFYLGKNSRERIIEKEGRYLVNNTDISWSLDEINKELEASPQRFSPNVIMRPLYQEVILPNLCYIGGGGELAYWFELSDYFKVVNVPFPILLLRNSVLLMPEKLSDKLDRLQLELKDLFLKQDTLLTKYTKANSDEEIDFSKQKQFLQEQFKGMYDIAKHTDKSFLGAVAAQEKKQLNGLAYLEKRLLRAQKRNMNGALARLKAIQDQLFPKQSLQERNTNFSEFYLELGEDLIPLLKNHLDPLCGEFLIIKHP